jgi:hypothetical protein
VELLELTKEDGLWVLGSNPDLVEVYPSKTARSCDLRGELTQHLTCVVLATWPPLTAFIRRRPSDGCRESAGQDHTQG